MLLIARFFVEQDNEELLAQRLPNSTAFFHPAFLCTSKHKMLL